MVTADDIENIKSNSMIKIDAVNIRKILHTLALDMYAHLSTENKWLQAALFSVGLFFCILGLKYKGISQASILSLFIFCIFYHYAQTIQPVSTPIENFARSILPEKLITFFNKEEDQIGILLLTILASSVLFSLLFWVKLMSLAFVAYIIYMCLEKLFIAYNPPYPRILCGISALICCYILHFLGTFLIDLCAGFFICFFGTAIVFSFIAKKAGYAEEFDKEFMYMIDFDIRVFSNYLFYGILITTCLLFCLQITGFKSL